MGGPRVIPVKGKGREQMGEASEDFTGLSRCQPNAQGTLGQRAPCRNLVEQRVCTLPRSRKFRKFEEKRPLTRSPGARVTIIPRMDLVISGTASSQSTKLIFLNPIAMLQDSICC